MVFLVDFVARGLGRGIHAGARYWVLFGLGAVVGPVLAGCARRPRRLRARAAPGARGPGRGGGAAPRDRGAALARGSSLVIGAAVPGVVPLVLGRVHELVPDDAEGQRAAWSVTTMAFALGQAAGAYGLSFLFARGGHYTTLFAVGAAALTLALAHRSGRAACGRGGRFDSVAAMTPTASALAWTTEEVRVAGSSVRLRTAGRGAPLLVLHHDIGTPEQLPFYDALADRFTLLLPSHPGYDGSERPALMRSVRDVAVTYQALLAQRGLADVALVGLGFGGWIAAEMATMSPRAFRRLVLVGAMGIKPAEGEILDQALVSYIDYVRAGFEDQKAFERLFGADPPTPQLEQWDLNREMTFRIAWKPYMYNPTLPPPAGRRADARR